MEVDVSSLARTPTRLMDATYAVFVVNSDEIRRSGATSIPEALRLVPGLDVARIDANKWAIGARGFNDRFSNKLLVMIDGRTIYTTTFSYVFWEEHDILLDDIDRIEVIRGPGASLWGVNAVNGVINIVRKTADATIGGKAGVSAGTSLKTLDTVRYGGTTSGGAWRVGLGYRDTNGQTDTTGAQSPDDGRSFFGGFRVDRRPSDRDSLTLQGDLTSGETGNSLDPNGVVPNAEETEFRNGNVLGRWSRTHSSDSESVVQVFVARVVHDERYASSREDLGDIDLQHRFKVARIHSVVVGGGGRVVWNRFSGESPDFQFVPADRTMRYGSVFAQDEIALVPSRLALTLGSKFEWNGFTGWEIQPTARLLYTPDEKTSFWTAVSRASRTPSRVDRDANFGTTIPIPFSDPVRILTEGNGGYHSEQLTAYEAGGRVRLWRRTFFDAAFFYNRYDDLRSIDGTADPTLFRFGNNGYGHTKGGEALVDVKVTDEWRLQGWYSFLSSKLSAPTPSRLVEFPSLSPRHQLSLRSFHDLPNRVTADLWGRYVSSLTNAGSTLVSSHFSLDARLGWMPKDRVELSITGRNLTDKNHLEFTSPQFPASTEEERSLQVAASVSF